MNGPGYLGPRPTVGSVIGAYDAQLNQAATQGRQAGLLQGSQMSAQDIADQQRFEREAKKAHRASELVEIARNLEYIRQRMMVLDLHDGTAALDQVIRDLILRWDTERDGR